MGHRCRLAGLSVSAEDGVAATAPAPPRTVQPRVSQVQGLGWGLAGAAISCPPINCPPPPVLLGVSWGCSPAPCDSPPPTSGCTPHLPGNPTPGVVSLSPAHQDGPGSGGAGVHLWTPGRPQPPAAVRRGREHSDALAPCQPVTKTLPVGSGQQKRVNSPPTDANLTTQLMVPKGGTGQGRMGPPCSISAIPRESATSSRLKKKKWPRGNVLRCNGRRTRHGGEPRGLHTAGGHGAAVTTRHRHPVTSEDTRSSCTRTRSESQSEQPKRLNRSLSEPVGAG